MFFFQTADTMHIFLYLHTKEYLASSQAKNYYPFAKLKIVEKIMVTQIPIAKRLKEIRLEIGLSQKQLGIAIGVDEFVASARMNQYETGKYTPNFFILQKIANIVHMPVAFFYTADDRLAQFIKLFYKLDAKQQNEILSIMGSWL